MGVPMNRFRLHVLLPVCMLVVVLAIASMPVDALGCRGRGWLASLVALSSGLGAIGAALVGLRGRIRGNANSAWWMTSSLLLTLPVIVLLILA